MQTTDYFKNDVMLKRPYIKPEWVLLALSNPVKREVQPADCRIRHLVWIEELARYLRVVTLEDCITVQNAVPDRRFSP